MRRRKRWISRGEPSAGRSAASSVRASRRRSLETGKPLEPLAEDRDQREPRRVRRVDAVEARRGAPERLEQAELVRAAEAVGREPLELAQDPLPGRLADEPGGGPHELLGLLVEPESELVLEAHRAQEPQRVVREDGRPDGAKTARRQVGLAAERVDERPAGQGPRERVDREVPRREVLLDRVAVKRGEVDRVPLPEGDAPGAVALREREDGAAGKARVEARGQLGIRAGDVDVHELPAEQLVAQRAADDPRRLVPDRPADALIHRRRSGRPGWGRGSGRT